MVDFLDIQYLLDVQSGARAITALNTTCGEDLDISVRVEGVPQEHGGGDGSDGPPPPSLAIFVDAAKQDTTDDGLHTTPTNTPGFVTDQNGNALANGALISACF